MRAFLLTLFSPVYAVIWVMTVLFKLLMGVDKGLFAIFFAKRDEPLTTHGDAEFGQYEELRKAGMLEPSGGFLLGKLDVPGKWGGRQHKVYADHESSAVIFGPRGSGKSMLIRANLEALKDQRELPDLIVLDPVGEIQRDFGKKLAKLGYATDYFDFTRPDDGLAYDPLSTLDIDSPTYDTDLRTFCTLILPDTVEVKGQHFTVLPRRLLSGAISYRLKCDVQNATLDQCLQAIVKPLKELQDEAKKWTALTGDPTIQNAITVSKVVADREFSGFITTMTDKFEPFLLPNWRALTQPERHPDGDPKRGWRWRDMYARNEPTCIFIRTGLYGEINGPCVRLLLGNAVNERLNMLQESGEGSFPRRLLIFTDETSNLGNCEALINVQNRARKAGVNILMTYLSRAEVFQAFPTAKTLLNGMTEFYPGGITDWETLKHASQMTFNKTVKGRGGSAEREGESWHETGVPLMSPQKIKQLPDNQWLVLSKRHTLLLEKPWRFEKRKVIY